jgi:two-component system, LytTR family, response regulator
LPGVASMPMRAVIVDDEPLSRELLRSLLADDPAVEVVGEGGNGREALDVVRRVAPDLLFLDVQMPELDGFGVVRELTAGTGIGARAPAVIFVTAYDTYALRAFEVHAIDYLLKPFDRERLRDAVLRARTMTVTGRADYDDRLEALLAQVQESRRHVQRLVVRSEDRAFFVRTSAIEWIEAAGKHVQLHVGRDTHPYRGAMSRIEEQLDPEQFVRVSRSAIVNIDCIQEIQPWFQGEYVLILASGTRLTTTRGYRENIQQLLGR